MQKYYFCGVGGSGMMPLAVYLSKRGHHVCGSDRSYDQKKSLDKFEALKEAGISLFPQDGSGVSQDIDLFVVSSAVEDHVPDCARARELNLKVLKRGALLAQFFNDADHSIAIAGTSGKSTVTGMIGTCLSELSLDPTVINGGRILNYKQESGVFFSNIRCGDPGLFVAEMDESDGSIAYFEPHISILNNIALDHKPIDELNALFDAYLSRTRDMIILNLDDSRVASFYDAYPSQKIIGFGIDHEHCDLRASNLNYHVDGVSFEIEERGSDKRHHCALNIPGRHNVENALAALGALKAYGIDLGTSIEALQKFRGIHRRLELVGQAKGVTIIDDFAHNPDKISASLKTLKYFDGRLIVIYQQHGYRALQMLHKELCEAFSENLGPDDLLYIPDVYYAGGTVSREMDAEDFVQFLKQNKLDASYFTSRKILLESLLSVVSAGDRVIIMGARDDTLHEFALEILEAIALQPGRAVAS